jgi:hypothetical protein
MLSKTFSQKGQALILIVLAIVGLVAITALAIDAGNSFSDRRHAQNAADTAALAGALTCAQEVPPLPCNLFPLSDQVTTYALDRARSNGYNNDSIPDTVTVNNPPVEGCNGTNGPYVGNPEYIQVIIHSTVNTFFAPIVGINQLNNCVEAIARAKPPVPVSLCYGALICALNTGTTPSDAGKNALRAFGGTNVTLVGHGAYSNSSHPTQALYVASNESLKLVQPYGVGVMAIGGINAPLNYPYPLAPHTTLPQLSYPLADIMIPKYTCDFTINNLPNNLPGGLPYLASGVYCVTGDFNKADYTNGTTDGKNIGGVTIVMLNNGFTWQSNITLNAPTAGPTAGLLVYIPYADPTQPPKKPLRAITFAGGGNLNIAGTILAPDSEIKYVGNYATSTFRSQLVGWEFEFGGSANGSIYQPPVIYEYPGIPSVELAR